MNVLLSSLMVLMVVALLYGGYVWLKDRLNETPYEDNTEEKDEE